jgi:hypothetical protein
MMQTLMTDPYPGKTAEEFQFTEDPEEISRYWKKLRTKVAFNRHFIPVYQDRSWKGISIPHQIELSDLRRGFGEDNGPCNAFGSTFYDRDWFRIVLTSLAPERSRPVWMFVESGEPPGQMAIIPNDRDVIMNVYGDSRLYSLSTCIRTTFCDETLSWVISTGIDEDYYVGAETALIEAIEKEAGGADMLELFTALRLASDAGWLDSEPIYEGTDWEMPPGLETKVRRQKGYWMEGHGAENCPAYRNMDRLIRQFGREAEFDLKKWFRIP